MPNYDGTGPFGDGRPGRGLGPCGKFEHTYGYGGGRRGRFYARTNFFRNIFDILRPIFYDDRRYNEPSDSSSLKSRKQELERELERVNNLIKETGKE